MAALWLESAFLKRGKFSYNIAMAKIEVIKEQITFLRFWLGIAVASLVAIVGFCATSYSRADVWLLALCFVCVVSLSVCAYGLSKAILRKIDTLKEL